MKRQTAIIFYFLAAYVVLQFAWWGFHLIELTEEAGIEKTAISKRIIMIIGEGMVFFLILLFGLFKIRASIRKDLELAERQKNFLLSVTHELKTPVAANKLFWQTIMKRELNQDKKNEIATKALEENDRLEQMIDNILNASRIESKVLINSFEQIDVNLTLQKTVDRFKKHSSKTIELQLPTESIVLSGDLLLLESCLSNLIGNAIKYGGEAPIFIKLIPNGKKFLIRIEDQGIGISIEHRTKIFSKFYRIEDEETRSQKGSGLGLYITAEFVRLLKGEIVCLPNEPKGTVFQLTFTHE
jgi:signal transduction histidine kinase